MRQKQKNASRSNFRLKKRFKNEFFSLESEAQHISPKMAWRDRAQDTGRRDGVLLFLLCRCRLAAPLICAAAPPRDTFYVLNFGGNVATFRCVSSDVSRNPFKIAGRCGLTHYPFLFLWYSYSRQQ